MTIIYQNRVATTSLGGFLKLLKTWRGSVYKLVYKELIIFCVLYAFVSLIYRLALTEVQKRYFEQMVIELKAASNVIPLSFILGFYVAFIVERWWQQFINVPWPDRTLFVMATYLHGFDDKSRMMRRTVARYIMFGLILICRNVSVSVMKRFPTLDHIVQAGFVSKEEVAMYEKVQCKYLKFWVPFMWANQVLVTARREGRIQTDFGLRMVIEYLADLRDKCSIMFVYDWITVPLVYTQVVVTLAVYSYFAVALVGQQYLDPSQKYVGFEGDFYIPGFTILQFLFYMGWLKVAEQMINPFGEDDDDYDINWLLDRHTDVAFGLADHCYGKHPPFIKDGFWGELTTEVPYTESSLGSVRPNFMGTTFNIVKPSLEAEHMIYADHEDISPWTNKIRRKSSLAGSVLSLFAHRPSRNNDSLMTLESTGSAGRKRDHSIGNGRLFPFPSAERPSEQRRSSIDVPMRRRANTDEGEFIPMQRKTRKLSLPFISVFSKYKPKRTSPVVTPKPVRATMNPNREEEESEPELQPQPARRFGSINPPLINMDKVSRSPELSAIDEGNLPIIPSVTSMSKMLPPRSRTSSGSDDDSDTQSSLREARRQYPQYIEPLIPEVDEEYITAYASSEPSSPVNSYLDNMDTQEDFGRRRSVQPRTSFRRH
ncbi:unnamed protein product [Lymnaea stagnalis]|uniref:Bestrophin homolog n=1 Tax=Lymnaea stagnalis TaxID=6523 RepID=A0AAV2I353_LYMST